MNTWLIDQEVLCITDKIVDIDIPQISASDKDTHGDSSEEKTVFIFNHIKNNIGQYDADWFVFIDDDAVLNTRYLKYILDKLDTNIIYGINMKGSYPQDTSLSFPSGGAGYLVSKQLIHKTPNMINHRYLHEDVNVGRYCRDNNIKIEQSITVSGLKHKILFNGWFPLEKYGKSISSSEDIQYIIDHNKVEEIFKNLTHHYIKNKNLMQLIYDGFSTWTTDMVFPIDNSIFSGFNTDKNTRHSYGLFYEELLSTYFPTGGKLLELGIMYGGSCAAFKKYNNQFNITGVDKFPLVEDQYKDSFKLVKGGLFYEKTIKALQNDMYDLIIDDMSHSISDIILAFNILSNQLKEKGVYVIEDIHEPAFMVDLFKKYTNLSKWNLYFLDNRKINNRFDDYILVITKNTNHLSLPTIQLSQ
jgi:hypothetical protein